MDPKTTINTTPKAGKIKRALAVAVTFALLLSLLPTLAQATAWLNNTRIVIRLQSQVLLFKFNTDIDAGSTKSVFSYWVKVNKIERIVIRGGSTITTNIPSTNCTGVYTPLSTYIITGDQSHVKCTKK